MIRLISGYKQKVFHTDLSQIKMAIFSDPNGLEVRIMELIKEHLGEEDVSKKTVFYLLFTLSGLRDWLITLFPLFI